MARSELLPIYIDSYRLIREVFSITVKFPREYKFVIGERLNNDALELCTLVMLANQADLKSDYLAKFLAKLEAIRLQARLCADLNLISVQRQINVAEMIEKISIQAHAWIKSERRKTEKKILPESGKSPTCPE